MLYTLSDLSESGICRLPKTSFFTVFAEVNGILIALFPYSQTEIFRCKKICVLSSKKTVRSTGTGFVPFISITAAYSFPFLCTLVMARFGAPLSKNQRFQNQFKFLPEPAFMQLKKS